MPSRPHRSHPIVLTLLLPALLLPGGNWSIAPSAQAQAPGIQSSQKRLETLQDAAELALWRGNYDEAIALYEQALALAQRGEDPEAEVALAWLQLGFAYFQKGNSQRAIAAYEQALAQITPTSMLNRGQVLAQLGMVSLSTGDYARSLSYAQDALAALHPGDTMTPAIVLGLQGEALYRTGQLREAETVLRRAIKAFESARLQVSIIANSSPNNTNAFFFELQASVSRTLQQVLVAEQQPQAALEIAEWGRGRIFAELLSLRLTPTEQQTTAQRQRLDVQQAYDQAIGVSQQLQQKLAQLGLQPEQLQTMSPEALEQLMVQMEQLGNQAQQELPDWINDPDNQQLEQVIQAPIIAPPTIQQIQQVARQQQATLVQYSVISDSTFGKLSPGREQQLLIWVIQPTGAIAFQSVPMQTLKLSLGDLVSDSRAAIGVQARGLQFREDPTVLSQAIAAQGKNLKLQELYQLLIQPIANQLPRDSNQRVIVIPQGDLFRVPFAALQDAKGRYLLETHTISTAPAIQVLMETNKQRQRLRQSGGQQVLVVGNPTMPQLQGRQLSNLPGSEVEARAIAQLFQTRAVLGPQATKTAVVQQMAQARIIHLATHGILHELRGSGIPGAIALAPSGTDDGWLTSGDLLGLNLKAELVVLSACDTGQGDITGDGVVGLSRSLIAAGVPSVIVSLWKVPDEPTAQLMTEFYQQLERTPNKAQALRQAMLKTKQAYPDPKDWAAFVLIGEAE